VAEVIPPEGHVSTRSSTGTYKPIGSSSVHIVVYLLVNFTRWVHNF